MTGTRWIRYVDPRGSKNEEKKSILEKKSIVEEEEEEMVTVAKIPH